MTGLLRTSPLRILMTGGTGFIGRSQCHQLLAEGHQLTLLTRSPERANRMFGGRAGTITTLRDLALTAAFDVVIHLAGEPISQRWTPAAKQRILQSRIGMTNDLVHWMQHAAVKPRVFISGSAIGVYGADASTAFFESTEPVQNAISAFSRQLCAEWEQAALAASSLGIRTCLLRTGVVLGRDGGALAKMLPAFRLGLGGVIGSGKQWFSWIHREDVLRIIGHLIHHEACSGAYNLTAPNPVTNAAFTQALGQALHRPTCLPMPAFVIKLLFGEMGEALLLNGQKVIPQRLTEEGFQFSYNTIETALAAIFQK